MKVLDIRNTEVVPTEIIFSDMHYVEHNEGDSPTYFCTGYKMHRYTDEDLRESAVCISDGTDNILIIGEDHARNLIKALEAAISIGWIK